MVGVIKTLKLFILSDEEILELDDNDPLKIYCE